jgi:uncharacterized protein YdaU (DUF1376 family)
MSNLPWMPVFPGDELAETAHLSTEEFGAYQLLKMALWQHKSLPQDEARLARIARLDAAGWATVRPMLLPLFGPGWTHEKLEQQRLTAEQASEKKSAAAKKAAQSRWSNRGPDAKGNANAYASAHADAYANASPAAYADAMPEQCGSNALQPQMKNSALEEGTSIRTHAREAEHPDWIESDWRRYNRTYAHQLEIGDSDLQARRFAVEDVEDMRKRGMGRAA